VISCPKANENVKKNLLVPEVRRALLSSPGICQRRIVREPRQRWGSEFPKPPGLKITATR